MKFRDSIAYRFILLACLAAFLLLVPAESGPQPDDSAGGTFRLTVAFTGDVNGYIEPCG